MRAMLAAAIDRLDQFRLVRLAIAIAVRHAPNAALIRPFVHGHPQHPVMPEKSVRTLQRNIHRLHLEIGTFGGVHPIDFPILIGADETALAIHGHRDP